jgi:hypothetical protein
MKSTIEFTASSGEHVTEVVRAILNTPPAVLGRRKKILIE